MACRARSRVSRCWVKYAWGVAPAEASVVACVMPPSSLNGPLSPGLRVPRTERAKLNRLLPFDPAVDGAVTEGLVDRDHVGVLGRVPGVDHMGLRFVFQRLPQVLDLDDEAEA